MQLSKRLTRAGAAFVVFGLVTAAVPNSAIMPAGACGGSSSNNTGAYVAGGVVLLGGGYLLFHPYAKPPVHTNPNPNTPTNSQEGQQSATPLTSSQYNDLHNFVYNNQ